MKVAVIGCGPAGLLAAHAAAERGHHVAIFSDKVEPSKIGGAQYLHEPIPGLTARVPSGHVHYAKIGSREGYAAKVYGKRDAPVSWDKFSGSHPAWPMNVVYGALWDKHRDRVTESTVTARALREHIAPIFDIVFCSMPRPLLCERDCRFDQAHITLLPFSYVSGLDNCVMYSGRSDDYWYRTSSIFGYEWTEVGMKGIEHPAWPGVRGQRKGVKPTGHACECAFQANVHFIGRFGRWEKGVLIHDAYREACRALH